MDSIPPSQSKSNNKWNFRKVDWHAYKTTITTTFQEVSKREIDPNNINKEIDLLETTTKMAAQESSDPIKNTNTKKRNTPWWNEECQAAMKESHKAFNKAKRKLRLKFKFNLDVNLQ